MAKLSLNDLKDFRGKTVFCRVDYNVPLDEAGKITDDKRIKATIPTLDYLVQGGAKIVLGSHLGRPKGKRDPKQSLRPCAAKLAELTGGTVNFADDCIGDKVEQMIAGMQPGQILLLENLRFYAEEEKNDAGFATKLAKGMDIYVNDAFGTAHRAHASTAAVAELVKKRGGKAAAGFLMEKELKYLGGVISNPTRPLLCILGGAKVSDKIKVIENLLNIADVILIGGAMAYTFRKAQGYSVGKSLCEHDKIDLAKSLLEKAKGKKFFLPEDQLQTTEFKAGAPTRNTDGPSIEDGWEGVDIGAATIETYKKEIAKAKTIVWNGPMGVFEIPDFAKGTFEIAKAVAQATKNGATTVIGGGDSAKAVKAAGLAKEMSFMSTGGGASLEFLEGKPLPGVAALSDK
ncbi:MAG: Phosphoglycerate kinase [Verrucomicrobiae bacterium]|nr:Phosphoglycerate kinase [Verrucomicrobiae bacterium]